MFCMVLLAPYRKNPDLATQIGVNPGMRWVMAELSDAERLERDKKDLSFMMALLFRALKVPYPFSVVTVHIEQEPSKLSQDLVIKLRHRSRDYEEYGDDLEEVLPKLDTAQALAISVLCGDQSGKENALAEYMMDSGIDYVEALKKQAEERVHARSMRTEVLERLMDILRPYMGEDEIMGMTAELIRFLFLDDGTEFHQQAVRDLHQRLENVQRAQHEQRRRDMQLLTERRVVGPRALENSPLSIPPIQPYDVWRESEPQPPSTPNPYDEWNGGGHD